MSFILFAITFLTLLYFDMTENLLSNQRLFSTIPGKSIVNLTGPGLVSMELVMLRQPILSRDIKIDMSLVVNRCSF